MNKNENILTTIFNENRAEWMQDFEDLFVAPAYIEKLESIRPAILIGGRGTGKTTSLHSLSYDATLERLEKQGLNFGDQEYLGVLVRMNKNRVKAFQGSHFSREQWDKLFGHYFNLLVCKELVLLTEWLQNKTGKTLSLEALSLIATDLALPNKKITSLRALLSGIKIAISELQVYVNNGDEESKVRTSIPESPLRVFVESLLDENLIGQRVIFCCVDEYENLSKEQQAIVNTYLKHSERPLSFKIGVRKKGLKTRSTIDDNDPIRVPDDCLEIEIVDEGFDFFATAVAEKRLSLLKSKGLNITTNLQKFLPDLPIEEEAVLLGAEKKSAEVLNSLKEPDSKAFEFIKDKTPFEISFLGYWARKNQSSSINDHFKDWLSNQKKWETRIENHGYASLFWISKGNKGQRIKKFYCGKRTLLSLAAGNIRYFIELIDNSIKHEYTDNHYKESKEFYISPQSQTKATTDVAKRRLSQLEGLTDNGVALKRLVLAIGKVFFEFARNPEHKAPEINSFVLDGNNEDKAKIIKLLEEGIGHLAFEAEPSTKATTPDEMRESEYRLHRIFTGFFEISHRKKRRTNFDAKLLLEVLEDSPKKAISQLINAQPKSTSDKKNKQIQQSLIDELPEQLAFFSSFYEGEA
ncbi:MULTISPECIES: hypothetical protein [unclassified Pseudoalteromonas]|uniref:ORC-CDC6 family AAA ATPase n=1 Tax=unclassified Pseudoalteromonas TaxID=194690 RepID=UPI003327D011